MLLTNKAATAQIEKLEGTIGERNTTITTLTGERDQARTDLKIAIDKAAKLEGDITILTGERDQARTDLKIATDKVAKLEGEAKTAEERAQAILANQGVKDPAGRLQGGNTGDVKTEDQLWDEYRKQPTAEAKRAFYKKHEAILGK